MEGCLRRTVLLTRKRSLLSKARSGLAHSLKAERYCVQCMQQHLPVIVTKKCFSTLRQQMPEAVKKGAFQDLALFKCRRRLASDSKPYVYRRPKVSKKNAPFVEYENEYFHSHLESSPEYQPYLLSSFPRKEAAVLQNETVAQLLQETKKEEKMENLSLLVHHWSSAASVEGRCVLSDPAFSQTVDLLEKHAKHFFVQDIMESMADLNRLGFRQNWQHEHIKTQIYLSKAFDKVCSKHVENLNVKELLLAADFFYSLRASKFVEFSSLMCERMKDFLPSLVKPELILLLFHMSMARKPHSSLTDAILNGLSKDMDSLSLQELGIINLAHFKTKSVVKNPAYFTALAEQFKTGISSDINPVCLSAVLKYQDKSLNKCMDQYLPEFFIMMKKVEEPLLSHIPVLPSDTLLHVLKLYYNVDLLSEDLFLAVVDRILLKGIRDWRLKDIMKVTHILTNIPLGSERKLEALAAVLVELQRPERQPERRDFPKCLLQIAVALTRCGVYPHWLATEVFGDKSQKTYRGSDKNYHHDLYHLSESIAIEDSSYDGPLLWVTNFPKVSKNKLYSKLMVAKRGREMTGGFVKFFTRYTTGNRELFNRDWALLELMDVLLTLRPEVTVLAAFPLSHYHVPDVEIRVHNRDQGKEETASDKFYLDRANFVSEAVVLHGRAAYQMVRCRDGNTVPLLRQYHHTRARQLRKLGAVVTEIPQFEFQNSQDKGQYLLTKFKEEEDRQLGLELD